MTQTQWFLLPLFLHIGLLNYVGVRSLLGRINAVRSGKTRLKEIALGTSAWPDDVRKLGNNFSNQFELPTFWYALTALVLILAKVDAVLIILSFAFLAARVVHTLIHTGSNFVPRRMYAFLASFTALTLMWLWLALRLYFIG